MNTRSLLILTISLGVVAIGLSILDRSHAQHLQDWGLPKDRTLVKEEVLKDTHSIVLHDGDKVVTLQPDAENKWSVVETRGMRADSSKFKSLVNFLTNGKLERFITEKAEKANALGIGKQYLEFLDAKGNSLGKLAIGDNAQVGGRFVRRNAESAIYRTNESYTLQADANEWIDKKLFQVTPEKIQHVTISNLPESNPSVEAQRQTGEDKRGFELAKPIEGFSFEPATLESGLRTLMNLRFTRVLDTSEVAEMDKLRDIAVTYTLGFNENASTESVVFKVARLPTPETDEEADKTTSSNSQPVYVWIEGNSTNALTHPVMTDKVFEVSSYSYDNLIRSPLKAMETPVEPVLKPETETAQP